MWQANNSNFQAAKDPLTKLEKTALAFIQSHLAELDLLRESGRDGKPKINASKELVSDLTTLGKMKPSSIVKVAQWVIGGAVTKVSIQEPLGKRMEIFYEYANGDSTDTKLEPSNINLYKRAGYYYTNGKSVQTYSLQESLVYALQTSGSKNTDLLAKHLCEYAGIQNSDSCAFNIVQNNRVEFLVNSVKIFSGKIVGIDKPLFKVQEVKCNPKGIED